MLPRIDKLGICFAKRCLPYLFIRAAVKTGALCANDSCDNLSL
jgi:hypothetical protein